MVTDQVVEASNDLGALGVLGVVILILVALLWITIRNMNTKVSDINHAVNNVKPGDPMMIDRVKHIEQMLGKVDDWMDDFNRHGWPSLPDDIGSAAALTETIRQIQNRLEQLTHCDREQKVALTDLLYELRELRSEVDKHVKWEMAEKYQPDGPSPQGES
jgi:hypothetical protein